MSISAILIRRGNEGGKWFAALQPVNVNDMRVLVMVKAIAESEAGTMPTIEEMAEMECFKQELGKAGMRLAAEGLHPSSKVRVCVSRYDAHGDRRPVRRDQGSGRRILALGGQLNGRGNRMGATPPEPDADEFREMDKSFIGTCEKAQVDKF